MEYSLPLDLPSLIIFRCMSLSIERMCLMSNVRHVGGRRGEREGGGGGDIPQACSIQLEET